MPLFNPFGQVDKTQANLPHWRQDLVTYFVTFRLVDSIPQEKLLQWEDARQRWKNAHPEPLSEEDKADYHEKFTATLENWLDQGIGSCLLRDPTCYQIIEYSLQFFEGDKYTLGEYVIAANHVHVVVTPNEGHQLSKILHSWKRHSAREINKTGISRKYLQPFWDSLNKRCNQAGDNYQRPVWQKESYDHIVRSAPSLAKIEEYIRGHNEWRPK